MRISDWSSDVCSSDLLLRPPSDRTQQCVVRAEGGSESYGICSHVRTPSGPDRSGRGPYYGEKAMSMTEEQWQKGLEVFDQVYGPDSSDMVKPFKDSPFNQEIVPTPFGNLWSNDELKIRKNRLTVLGDTTMPGPAIF